MTMTDLPEGITVDEAGLRRCGWCGTDPEYRRYHDEEWGFPVDEDRRLFEKICLEAFQAGLSWLTILKKRENFRLAFDNFDPQKVARYNDSDVERLLQNKGIIRNRRKIEASINNAARTLEIAAQFGSLAAFIWQFEPPPEQRPKTITYDLRHELTKSPASTQLAKALKSHGFRFIGPTTAYAFMQSVGLVNDHLHGCSFHRPVEEARANFQRPR